MEPLDVLSTPIPGVTAILKGTFIRKAPLKNKWGAQRGSVQDMPIYPGDPLTPNIGATGNAKRLDRSEAANLLKIPVLPILMVMLSPSWGH